MVECEFVPVTAVAPALYSFNRYMVECEYSCCIELELRFNRYIVE